MHEIKLNSILMAEDDTQDIVPETPINLDGTSKPEQDSIAPQDSSEDANQEAVDTNSDAQPEIDQEELNKKAEESKMSKLEKERNQAAIQAQQAVEREQAYLASLDVVFRDDPVKYEKWRQEIIARKGIDYGSHEEVYKTTQQNGNQVGNAPIVNQNNTNRNLQSNSITPDQVYYMMEEKKAYDSFLETHPEYDPRAAADTYDVEVRKMDLQTVRDMALTVMANAKAKGRNLGFNQAMEQAHTALRSQDALNEAKEDGRLVGKQEAYAKATGATASIGGQTSKGNTGPTLTEEERAIAKMMKVSEEAYLAQKK
jgi:hypothetical protein